MTRLLCSIFAEAADLAVRTDDGDLALAALRLREGGGPEREAAALFDVYARAATLGRRSARAYRRYEGPLGAEYCEAVRPELERATALGRLVVRALKQLGRTDGR